MPLISAFYYRVKKKKRSYFSHLALDWVGLGCQVLPPAHAGVVSDEGLLLDQRDAHGLRKLLGAPCCQAHVTRLKLRSKFLSVFVPVSISQV